MNSRLLSLVVALGLTTACTNTMSGKVDGVTVERAQSAVFDEVTYDIPFVGETRLVMLIVSSMPDACAVLTEVASQTPIGCDDVCDEYSELATEFLGGDSYQHLSVAVHVEDEIEREFYYDTDLGDDEFSARMDTWDTTLLNDRPACEDACDAGDSVMPTETEDGEGGDFEITSYTAGDALSGNYRVGFGGGDEVSGRFDATECDLSAWVWWL